MGWRFPVVMISMLVFTMLLLVSVLLIPESASAASAFAEDFKVWCFGYDPTTGEMEWAYVWMFLIQPFFLIGLMLLVWFKPLKEVASQALLKMVPYVAVAFVVVCSMGASFTLLVDSENAPVDPTAFPAERIRTHHTPAPFALTNQDGDTVSLASLQGRVVLITAVYATCGYTCPMILAQTKRAVSQLAEEEKEDLTIIAITLDPEHDTPEVLKRLTNAQEVEAPFFNTLTGSPTDVNEILDRYGFSRSRDPETGIIDHVNLMILIDRGGLIAYRFSLGEQQEHWLTEALHYLIEEGEETS